MYRPGIHVAGDADATLVHASQIEGAAHQVVFVGVGIAGGMAPEGCRAPPGSNVTLSTCTMLRAISSCSAKTSWRAAIVAIRPTAVITGKAPYDQLSGNTQAVAGASPALPSSRIADVPASRAQLIPDGGSYL